jgi:hypothetical protein
MTQELALTITVIAVLLLLVLLAYAWWRRMRRDAAPLAPHGELPADATVLGEFDGLYVATTRHDEPLERLAAPGLGFRSRATIIVTDRGVALDLTGQPRILLTPDRLVDVGQSTVAIDRVVEKDGLTRLSWRTLTGSLVDTYLRSQGVSAKTLSATIRPLVPASGPTTPAPTGSDA